jgi:hypothetical protein
MYTISNLLGLALIHADADDDAGYSFSCVQALSRIMTDPDDLDFVLVVGSCRAEGDVVFNIHEPMEKVFEEFPELGSAYFFAVARAFAWEFAKSDDLLDQLQEAGYAYWLGDSGYPNYAGHFPGEVVKWMAAR